MRVGREYLLGGLPHGQILLHADDLASRVQEEGRKDPGPRPDIRHRSPRPQTELVVQQVDDSRGIMRSSDKGAGGGAIFKA